MNPIARNTNGPANWQPRTPSLAARNRAIDAYIQTRIDALSAASASLPEQAAQVDLAALQLEVAQLRTEVDNLRRRVPAVP